MNSRAIREDIRLTGEVIMVPSLLEQVGALPPVKRCYYSAIREMDTDDEYACALFMEV